MFHNKILNFDSLLYKANIILGISILSLYGCNNHSENDTFRSMDEGWVNRSIELHFGKGDDNRRNALKIVSPVVIYLPNEICVGLNLKDNTVGGDPVTCFSKEDGSITLIYTEGE